MTIIKYKTKIVYFGILGLLATMGVGLGEFLLHYTPDGIGYASENFDFFKYIPLDRLTMGHFVAIAFTPLYILGYYHFYLIFKVKNPRFAMAILVLGIIAFMIGGMWISSRAFLGHLVHQLAEHPEEKSLLVLMESYKFHYEILVKSLRIWIAAISVIFIIPILKNRTIYPQWMALLNPLLLLIIVKVTYEIAPSIGNIIGPIAMNVVHFILFGVSLIIVIRNKSITKSSNMHPQGIES